MAIIINCYVTLRSPIIRKCEVLCDAWTFHLHITNHQLSKVGRWKVIDTVRCCAIEERVWLRETR